MSCPQRATLASSQSSLSLREGTCGCNLPIGSGLAVAAGLRGDALSPRFPFLLWLTGPLTSPPRTSLEDGWELMQDETLGSLCLLTCTVRRGTDDVLLLLLLVGRLWIDMREVNLPFFPFLLDSDVGSALSIILASRMALVSFGDGEDRAAIHGMLAVLSPAPEPGLAI